MTAAPSSMGALALEREDEGLRIDVEHLALLLESTASLAWRWHVDSGRVHFFPDLEVSLGYKPGEVEPTAAAIAALVHPDDWPSLLDGLRAVTEGSADSYACEHRLRRGDGEWSWFRNSGRAVRRRAGAPPEQVAGVLHEVTPRMRTELELADREREIETLAARLILAEERERRRIAEGLHDDIGQNLAAVKVKLATFRKSVGSDEAAEECGELIDLVDRVIRQTRSLTFELSSPVLHGLGLGAAVENLLDQAGREHGLCVQLNAEGSERHVPPRLRTLLYRSVRELLTNVVKHARAERVRVELLCADDRIEIEVADDGVGFDVSRDPLDANGGFGLFSIRHALAHVGGRFRVDSSVETGTRVTLTAPVGGTAEVPA